MPSITIPNLQGFFSPRCLLPHCIYQHTCRVVIFINKHLHGVCCVELFLDCVIDFCTVPLVVPLIGLKA